MRRIGRLRRPIDRGRETVGNACSSVSLWASVVSLIRQMRGPAAAATTMPGCGRVRSSRPARQQQRRQREPRPVRKPDAVPRS